MKKEKLDKRRVIALLDREQIEFLDRLSTDSSFSTGHKLSRVDIISALVQAAMAMRISAASVRNRQDLVEKMLDTSRTDIDLEQFPEIQKGLGISFRELEALPDCRLSPTEDMNRGGFRMEISNGMKFPSCHQLIEISLKESQSSEALKAIGKVAWVHPKPDGQGCEIGVKVAHMTQEDWDRFHGLLHQGARHETS